MLTDIADAVADSSLDLHISIFVTCPCHGEDVPPPIPKSTVTTTRPDVHKLLGRMLSPTLAEGDTEDGNESRAERAVCQGGVGVCASGPEGLTREAANAVARLAPVHGRRVGGIALHTEVFCL